MYARTSRFGPSKHVDSPPRDHSKMVYYVFTNHYWKFSSLKYECTSDFFHLKQNKRQNMSRIFGNLSVKILILS